VLKGGKQQAPRKKGGRKTGGLKKHSGLPISRRKREGRRKNAKKEEKEYLQVEVHPRNIHVQEAKVRKKRKLRSPNSSQNENQDSTGKKTGRP